MKQTKLLVLAGLCAALLALPALAADPWTEVDAAEVKRMLDEDDATVIFPLSRIEFNNEHIPGSVNIPMQKIRSDLPGDKDRKLVFYCLGRR